MRIYQIRTADGYRECILEDPSRLSGEWSIVTVVKPEYTADREICGCKGAKPFRIRPGCIVGYEVVEFEGAVQ